MFPDGRLCGKINIFVNNGAITERHPLEELTRAWLRGNWCGVLVVPEVIAPEPKVSDD